MGSAARRIKGTDSSSNRLVGMVPQYEVARLTYSNDVGSNAPIVSLACSASGNSIAAGTEFENHQASILIWDARAGSAPQIQYNEVHSDDVTEVRSTQYRQHDSRNMSSSNYVHS